MNWWGLSLNEWRRHPLRSGITAAGVAIAMAALFSLLAFQQGYQEGIRKELDGLGAHVLLVPKGCPYDAASMALHGANWPCFLKQIYLQEVRGVQGVAAAAPVFMSAVYDATGRQAVYLGVDRNILALKPAWRIQGRFPAAGQELLAGSEVAREAGWRTGDRIKLPGLTNQHATVAGILAPTQGPDDTFLYLPIPEAQRLFHHTNELTHILIRLADPNQLETAVKALRGCDAGLAMNVVPVTHVFRTIRSLVNSTRLFMASIVLVALVLAGAGVANTVLMAVHERVLDIGLMRAIGASAGDILRLIWLETLEVCLPGAIAGIGLAMVGAKTVETWARAQLPFAPRGTVIHWDPAVAAWCALSALLLACLAAFLPAWHAARIPPAEAIRTGKGRM